MIRFKFRVLFVICLIFLVNGCGPKQMALMKDQQHIDLSQQSIVLVSIKIANKNKPNAQPTLDWAYFSAISEEAESIYLPIGIPYKSVDKQYNEYLASFQLTPGMYRFSAIDVSYKVPLLVSANARMPIFLKLEVTPNSVIYIGNIDASIREKIDDERPAGSLIPLIDQSVAGFSNGTFDIFINDKYEDDMKLFFSEYPVLQKVKVEKKLLPHWIRLDADMDVFSEWH